MSFRYPRRGRKVTCVMAAHFCGRTPNVTATNGGFYNLIEGCYNLNVWVSDLHVVAGKSRAWWQSIFVAVHPTFRMPLVVFLTSLFVSIVGLSLWQWWDFSHLIGSLRGINNLYLGFSSFPRVLSAFRVPYTFIPFFQLERHLGIHPDFIAYTHIC